MLDIADKNSISKPKTERNMTGQIETSPSIESLKDGDDKKIVKATSTTPSHSALSRDNSSKNNRGPMSDSISCRDLMWILSGLGEIHFDLKSWQDRHIHSKEQKKRFWETKISIKSNLLFIEDIPLMLLQLYAYFVTESNSEFEISSAIFLVLIRNFIVVSMSIFKIIYIDAVNNRPRFIKSRIREATHLKKLANVAQTNNIPIEDERELSTLQVTNSLHSMADKTTATTATAVIETQQDENVWEISISFLILYYIFVLTELYCRFSPIIVLFTKLHYLWYKSNDRSQFYLVVTATILGLILLEFVSFYWMVEFNPVDPNLAIAKMTTFSITSTPGSTSRSDVTDDVYRAMKAIDEMDAMDGRSDSDLSDNGSDGNNDTIGISTNKKRKNTKDDDKNSSTKGKAAVDFLQPSEDKSRSTALSLSFNRPIFFADGNLDQTRARYRIERRLYKQAKRDLKVRRNSLTQAQSYTATIASRVHKPQDDIGITIGKNKTAKVKPRSASAVSNTSNASNVSEVDIKTGVTASGVAPTSNETEAVQMETIPPKVGPGIDSIAIEATIKEEKEVEDEHEQITTQITSQTTFGSDGGDEMHMGIGYDTDGRNHATSTTEAVVEAAKKEVEDFAERVKTCENFKIYLQNILYIFAGVFSAAIYTFLILDLSFLKTKQGLRAVINKDRFVMCHFVRMLVSLGVVIGLFVCIYDNSQCATTHETGLVVLLYAWIVSLIVNFIVGKKVGDIHAETGIYSYGRKFNRKEFIKRVAKIVGALLLVGLIVLAIVYLVVSV